MLAPAFSLEGLDGRPHALRDHEGRRVLVALLRNARCAVCNLWVHTTAKLAPRWAEDGLDVITIFESTADRLRAQFEEHRPPFAVLADPDGRVHEAYGSRSDEARVREIVANGLGHEALARAAAAGFAPVQEDGANFFRLPAEVLIDRDGSIALAHVAEDVANHLDPAWITRFARGGLPEIRRER